MIEVMSELGQALVAIGIVAGLVVLKALGKPTDGLDLGVEAIILVYFGGKITTKQGSQLIDAVQAPPPVQMPPPVVTVQPATVTTVAPVAPVASPVAPGLVAPPTIPPTA